MSTASEQWAEYRDAMAGMAPATLSEGDVPPRPDVAQVDRLLEASEKLTESIERNLTNDRSDVRELAALQLEAAAVVDLDRANSLVAADEESGLAATLSSSQWETIDQILETPTEEGIQAVMGTGGHGFEATASEAPSLKEAVDTAIAEIAADAAKAASTTVKGLTGIPGDDVKKAFGDGIQKVFDNLGEKVNWLKRKAVELVLKAVKKLLAIFGTDTSAVQKKIDTWLDELNEEKVNGLLERLYDVDGLEKKYNERLEKAGDIASDRDQAAREELDALKAKWHKRAGVIDTLGGIIPFARTWISALSPPAGEIAYTVGFAMATGYVVFAGGDYLDWREDDGLLDLADGVGSVVDRAAGAVPAP